MSKYQGLRTDLLAIAWAFAAILLGLSLGAAPVLAEEGHGRRHGPPSTEKMLVRWQTSLDLTDAQVAELEPMLERHRQERRTIMEPYMEQGREGMRQSREVMKPLREQHRAELASILSEDQMAQLDANRQAARERMKERYRQHRRRSSEEQATTEQS